MSTKPTDSSGISFTALYTGAVWHRYGLSDDALATAEGRMLYHLMTPLETTSRLLVGGNIRTFLLQRHLLIDHLIERAITDNGINQVLEIACGMSPRGIRLRDRHPHLHMVEADLPDMAARKAARLASMGRLGAHHQIVPTDILAADGANNLEALVCRIFDANRPLIVVTEGLTSYFSLEVISDFWRRLAGLLATRPGSLYLSESYLMPGQPLLRTGLQTLGRLLGAVTQSQVSFHFSDETQARQHFLSCGFPNVAIYNPANFYGQLPIPQSRKDPMVRVVAAST